MNALWVALPRPLGRRMRIGPFASANALLRFVTVATVGALVAAMTSPFVWIPFAALGLFLATAPSSGPSLDRRLVSYARWHARRALPDRSRTEPRPADFSPEGSGRLGSVIVHAEGIPVAFLPPAAVRSLFDAWRTYLRSLDLPMYIEVGGSPLVPGSFVGAYRGPRESPEREAAQAYREFVRLLTRRRQRRRVRVALSASAVETESGRDRLEAAADGLLELLERLSIPAGRIPAESPWSPSPPSRP